MRRRLRSRGELSPEPGENPRGDAAVLRRNHLSAGLIREGDKEEGTGVPMMIDRTPVGTHGPVLSCPKAV